MPLFNLSGTLVIHERPDGAKIDLVDGDFSPGKLIFTATPRAARRQHAAGRRAARHPERGLADPPPRQAEPGGRARRAGRRVLRHAARGRAARRERRRSTARAVPRATPAPPPVWSPSARALADEKLAALRAHGAVALVARTWSQRLAGVAVAMTLGVPAPNAIGRLRDPESWHAFPGWRTVEPRAGPNGHGGEGRGQPAVRRPRGDVDGRARQPAALDRHGRRDHRRAPRVGDLSDRPAHQRRRADADGA